MSIARETAAERKALPIASGVLDYFPDALLAVAEVSRVGNEQHNPGQPLHWAKEKSTDEADALLRHLIDRGKLDTDGMRHSAKVAWRALALLQRELDAEAAQPHPLETDLRDVWWSISKAQAQLGLSPCGGDEACDGTCRSTEPPVSDAVEQTLSVEHRGELPPVWVLNGQPWPPTKG